MIFVIVPTIRPDSIPNFLSSWDTFFKKHSVFLIIVNDGNTPNVNVYQYDNNKSSLIDKEVSVAAIMGKYEDSIFNFNSGVRNLGFAYYSKFFSLSDLDIIITIDDDTEPYGDSIEDHLNALNMYVSTSWLATGYPYMRGFPYSIRQESEVVVSHGIWHGQADYDAPTQLLLKNKNPEFYKGTIPTGIFYPMSSMNLAFKSMVLSQMYQAPMGPRVGVDRFEDIWCGVTSKYYFDDNNLAVVSGYSAVKHERASDVFKNLRKESLGLEWNERFFSLWKSVGTGKKDSINTLIDYISNYKYYLNRWQEFCEGKT